jgi:hypothetical protein
LGRARLRPKAALKMVPMQEVDFVEVAGNTDGETMNEETQRRLIAALVERVMALETWREKVEQEKEKE